MVRAVGASRGRRGCARDVPERYRAEPRLRFTQPQLPQAQLSTETPSVTDNRRHDSPAQQECKDLIWTETDQGQRRSRLSAARSGPQPTSSRNSP
jgi:hypothetical protein